MLNKFKPKSEFSKNVLTLMTGTTIAQAIPIGISPILTRLYTPEDFGIFALYMSVASIMSVIATGRYELAIMLPKKDEDAFNIVMLSIIITAFISFLSFLIAFFLNSQITALLGNPQISNWLYFIPITILFTGGYQSFNYWFNRKKQYKRLAQSKILRSGTTVTVNVSMGIGKLGSGGLIIGALFGQGIATFNLFQIALKNDKEMMHYVKKLKIFALIKKFKKFPLLNLPNALVDAIRVSGINILIAKFFTASALGQFSLAWKIVQMPISLIGNSISQVFFQKVSSVKKSELNTIVKKFIFKASAIALPLFLILYFFAEEIFVFIFGQNWRLAGQIVSILSPWLFLRFLTSPLSNIFIVLNKQEISLIFSIFYMLTPIVILLFFSDKGLLNNMSLITFSMSFILFLYMAFILIKTKKEKHYGL